MSPSAFDGTSIAALVGELLAAGVDHDVIVQAVAAAERARALAPKRREPRRNTGNSDNRPKGNPGDESSKQGKLERLQAKIGRARSTMELTTKSSARATPTARRKTL